MSPLAYVALRILRAEIEFGPMTVLQVRNTINATGYAGRRVEVDETETALEELLRAGQVERLHSIRLGPRYRILRSVQAGNAGRS